MVDVREVTGSSPVSSTKTKGHPKGCPFVLGSAAQRRLHPSISGAVMTSRADSVFPQGSEKYAGASARRIFCFRFSDFRWTGRSSLSPQPACSEPLRPPGDGGNRASPGMRVPPPWLLLNVMELAQSSEKQSHFQYYAGSILFLSIKCYKIQTILSLVS